MTSIIIAVFPPNNRKLCLSSFSVCRPHLGSLRNPLDSAFITQVVSYGTGRQDADGTWGDMGVALRSRTQNEWVTVTSASPYWRDLELGCRRRGSSMHTRSRRSGDGTRCEEGGAGCTRAGAAGAGLPTGLLPRTSCPALQGPAHSAGSCHPAPPHPDWFRDPKGADRIFLSEEFRMVCGETHRPGLLWISWKDP